MSCSMIRGPLGARRFPMAADRHRMDTTRDGFAAMGTPTTATPKRGCRYRPSPSNPGGSDAIPCPTNPPIPSRHFRALHFVRAGIVQANANYLGYETTRVSLLRYDELLVQAGLDLRKIREGVMAKKLKPKPKPELCPIEVFDNGFWSLHCKKKVVPGTKRCKDHQHVPLTRNTAWE